MHDDTQMTLAERRKYVGRMRPHYLLANRAEQSRLLDDIAGDQDVDHRAERAFGTSARDGQSTNAAVAIYQDLAQLLGQPVARMVWEEVS